MQRILSRAFPSTSSSVSTATTFIVDRRPPPDLGKWANFKRFIWNREKHTFCNRTCSSWCKIICFYMVFLVLMLGLFFIMTIGATEYLKNHYKLPWINKNSLTENGNPGVGFIPNIIRVDSPLLWYTFQGAQSLGNMKYETYVKHIDRYLKKYDEAENYINDYSNCSISKDSKKPCIFRRKDLGPCGRDEFGYPDKKPCIYIKINKLTDWRPIYYKADDDLPFDMPKELQKIIKADRNKEKLWIYCDGLSPPDEEHLGKMSYYPQPGIMGYYFPYTGLDNYLVPIVAVKIDNIKSKKEYDSFERTL